MKKMDHLAAKLIFFRSREFVKVGTLDIRK